MYMFDKIKLIIWDLDEPFWKGTISEGTVFIPDNHIELVRRLTDIGIINSICSKNNLQSVDDKLKECGVRDFFVFPSVNWHSKGTRIKQLITDLQLRPANVLFLDDNSSNLNEALFYCPELMTAGPEVITDLLEAAYKSTKEDKDHRRLAQYKILEKKHAAQALCPSNEKFLFSSGIKVDFENDCQNHLERIHDLVWRSNQLNFTKVRSTQEELSALFADNAIQCGYVSVNDKFGDYGITGFYALKGDKLIHFCFSCRILGMGIEQYVYNYLQRPKLEIVGEVISDLTAMECPKWINQIAEQESDVSFGYTVAEDAHIVLMKGPCDLFQILPYIANKRDIDTEFTYTASNGTVIESTGHTTHLVEAMRLTTKQKNLVIREIPFLDMGIYRDSIYRGNYKIVIISILQDANLGVYRRKETGERFAFAEGFRPITDMTNWEKYIKGEYNSSGVKFTEEMLEQFAEKYEFVGINTPEQIVQNLRFIKSHLPKDCTLAVMLGGELYYEKNIFPAYETRHLIHKSINSAVRACAGEIGLELIDVNRYLVDQSSFYDHFNHYIKPVYYALAEEIVALVNRQTGLNIHETSKMKMAQVRIKEFLAPYYYKIRKLFGR